MTVAAGYDPIGTKCLGKAQPGTKALQDACLAAFGTTSDGIYNCRNVRGGTTKSAHAEGRAVDVHWTNEATGRVIADFLVDHAADLGIQCVIWWDRIWSNSVGHWHDYHGADAHHSHLHVEQNWSGANNLTRQDADTVLALFQGDDMPLDANDKKWLTDLVYNIGKGFADAIIEACDGDKTVVAKVDVDAIAKAVADEEAKRLAS